MPAYEVRCAACDVSFPVGTKVCIHCGGRTAADSDSHRLEAMLEEVVIREGAGGDPYTGGYGHDDLAEDTAADSMRSGSSSTTPAGPSVFGEDAPGEGEESLPSGPQGTILRLIRSMGGVIWIVLFIIFSLAQNCEK